MWHEEWMVLILEKVRRGSESEKKAVHDYYEALKDIREGNTTIQEVSNLLIVNGHAFSKREEVNPYRGIGSHPLYHLTLEGAEVLFVLHDLLFGSDDDVAGD